MKYIVIKRKLDASLDQELPVVFPNHFVHSEVFKALLRMPDLRRAIAISAGEFCPLSGECSGKSETLSLKSRGIVDTRLIRMHDYTSGMV